MILSGLNDDACLAYSKYSTNVNFYCCSNDAYLPIITVPMKNGHFQPKPTIYPLFLLSRGRGDKRIVKHYTF